MEITGKITNKLPLQEGQGKNGTWKKQYYVLEQPGQYAKKVCFSLWGDKVDSFPMNVGDEVKVSIDIESREYNERWYTDVKAWKVERASAGTGTHDNAEPMHATSLPDSTPAKENDDLPF